MTDLITQSDFFDLSNPQHFINLVPASIREAVLRIPPELFELTERQLILRTFKAEVPDDLDSELRISFWDEYNDKFTDMKPMLIENIIKGICSRANFNSVILKNPYRTLYMVTEISVIKNRLKHAFHLHLNEMVRIGKMKEEINAKTGTTDTKLLDLKFKIFEYLDQRLHGSLIQRTQTQIEQKSVNVNINTTIESQPQTPEAIDMEIQKLEQELSQHQALPPAQPAEPIQMLMDKIQQEAGRVSKEYDVNKRTINQDRE